MTPDGLRTMPEGFRTMPEGFRTTAPLSNYKASLQFSIF